MLWLLCIVYVIQAQPAELPRHRASPRKRRDGRGFESHLRQLIFYLKNNCLGQVVLCCLAFLSKHLMDESHVLYYMYTRIAAQASSVDLY